MATTLTGKKGSCRTIRGRLCGFTSVASSLGGHPKPAAIRGHPKPATTSEVSGPGRPAPLRRSLCQRAALCAALSAARERRAHAGAVRHHRHEARRGSPGRLWRGTDGPRAESLLRLLRFHLHQTKKMNRALLFELGTDAGRADGRHARGHAQGILRDAQRRLAARCRRSRQAKTATGRRRPDSPLRTRPLPTSTRGRSARAPVPPARQTGPAGIGFAPWPKLPRRARCQSEFKAGRRPRRGA